MRILRQHCDPGCSIGKFLVRLCRQLLLFLLGLLFACLLAEAVLRIYDYEGLSLMQKDPVLGQIYKPNYRDTVYDSESFILAQSLVAKFSANTADRIAGRVHSSKPVTTPNGDTYEIDVRFVVRMMKEPDGWRFDRSSVAGFV